MVVPFSVEDAKRALTLSKHKSIAKRKSWKSPAKLKLAAKWKSPAKGAYPIRRTSPVELPSVEERWGRLLELTQQVFPDGTVPDSFTVTGLSLSRDPLVTRLPFIKATSIVITSDREAPNPVPAVVFRDVMCLWDTGAPFSTIVTDLLDPVVRNDMDEGFARMEILFEGVTRKVDSIINFRPTLPHGATFIILGQHGLIDRLRYQVQPISFNPEMRRESPEVYGHIELISWCDPSSGQVFPL